jgi:glycosyltransferase involved in cell wall biosynthesis
MSNIAEISFIICTYNRADYLDDSLASLLAGNTPVKPVEILVVNNNSADETGKVINRYINHDKSNITVRSVTESKQGLSHARNRGIREAEAPIVIFVDDDIRADTNYINAWGQFFEDYPDVRAAGGKIHVQFDAPRPEWMSQFLLPLLGHHDYGNSIKPYRKTNYPFGGNMAFKKEVFNRFGLFDTGLGRIGKDLKASEEKEYFQRLKKENTQIFYVPEALLYHRVGASRLTREYIQRQAIGLGQSLARQFRDQSAWKKFITVAAESGKWFVSLALFLPYTLAFKFSKALMLIKFRKWIAEGVQSARNRDTKSDFHD